MPYFKLKNNKKIFYIEKGRGKNTILFLHCWAGNWKFWKYQLEEFSKGYTCIAIDFPGHGNSDEFDEYGPYPFAEVVGEFISQLKFKNRKFIIAGHSLGGMTAMQVALEHKSRVKALILVDTSAHLRGHIGQNIASPVAAFFAPIFTDIIKRYGIYLTAFHPYSNFKEKKFVADEALKVSNHVLTQVLHGINQFNVENRLCEIKVPTLIIVGTADIYTDIRHAITLRYGIKNSTLSPILFAGHCSLLERPQQINSAIRGFLKEI